jgi:preprotein translocase subunit YajC
MPGDPVVTASGETARVMFARSDGTVFLELNDGRKLALHEDAITWAQGFQPTRRG